jgi:replicative DNA helicase
MAHAGQCKTAAVQNILACNASLPGIFFELELSGPQMFERAAAISTGYDAWRISQIYDEGNHVDSKTPAKFANLLTCTASLSMKDIDAATARASAKLGCLPRVFVIDYAQLVRGYGTRYDRMSETCEEAKRLAKKWNAIGIIVSQVGRAAGRSAENGDDSEVGLYDAKEGGSFENSCGLVLGVWKTSPTEMVCHVLKNTRGYAGKEAPMQLRGNTYIIELETGSGSPAL